jgi:hypothetical protein
MAESPKEKCKFYADTPSEKNKYFCWNSHNVDNSLQIVGKFMANGCAIRAAFHEFENGRSMRITEEQLSWAKEFYSPKQKKIW